MQPECVMITIWATLLTYTHTHIHMNRQLLNGYMTKLKQLSKKHLSNLIAITATEHIT